MRNFLLYFIAFFIIAACANTKPVSTETDTQVIDEKTTLAGWQLIADSAGKPQLATTSVHYKPFILMLSDLPIDALLAVTHQSKAKATDTLTIETYHVTDTALLKLSSCMLPGSQYRFFNTANNLLAVETTGSRKTPATNYLLNLINGQLVCTYTQPLATLTVPSTAAQRYTGYHNRNSTIPLTSDGTPENWVGILTYAKPSGTIASAALQVNDSRLMEQMRQFPPEVFYLVERNGTTIRTRDLDLYPPAGNPPITTPDGFSIELNFGKIRAVDNVQIPVINDQWALPVLPDKNMEWVHINE